MGGVAPREYGFEGQCGLTAGIPQDWEIQKLHSWRAHTGSHVHQDKGNKSSGPIKDWARITC